MAFVCVLCSVLFVFVSDETAKADQDCDDDNDDIYVTIDDCPEDFEASPVTMIANVTNAVAPVASSVNKNIPGVQSLTLTNRGDTELTTSAPHVSTFMSNIELVQLIQYGINFIVFKVLLSFGVI